MSNKHFPFYGYMGILLVAVFWYLNWSLSGLRTHWGFFPLWLGYCLTVDALCVLRTGSSLIRRNVVAYICLFLVSAPFWWLFEAINSVTHYWNYNAREQFSDLEYYFFASLSFSTVIPALFGTAELTGSFFGKHRITGPVAGKTKKSRMTFLIAGIVLLVITLILPQYSAAFIWMSIYMIVDPVNHRLGGRTLFRHTARGDWTEVIILWTGSLICGFFWEFWNYYSNPKWFYSVPYIDFWYVFEMPLPGYLGYLPFILEAFAVYHLVLVLFNQGQLKNYVKLLPNS